ncbi:YheV family putative metal-binding protein [Parahaliea mediterranea]|uniref:YheV family putative metal-binding protein n=1 Tax=Parahaliea mediterranea TaxID=651086 RepID=A0A939DFE0_9GAMM|nr:YheV family putative metal-binding protein [Parahaliea mediterranea]MBN7797110.1 YheV family putative metal-binding protein [Parahaliea mediterranea]
MSGFSASRRFIAGAVCPRCRTMDSIVVDTQSEQRECVACGFSEARPADGPRQEPRTRVNRPARRGDAPAEAVRLVDPAAAPGTDRERG